MSPSLRDGPYKLTVHTGNEDPPPHVHVWFEGKEVRINLYTLKPLDQVAFQIPRKLINAVEEHREKLIEWWEEYHPPRQV